MDHLLSCTGNGMLIARLRLALPHPRDLPVLAQPLDGQEHAVVSPVDGDVDVVLVLTLVENASNLLVARSLTDSLELVQEGDGIVDDGALRRRACCQEYGEEHY